MVDPEMIFAEHKFQYLKTVSSQHPLNTPRVSWEYYGMLSHSNSVGMFAKNHPKSSKIHQHAGTPNCWTLVELGQ